MPDSEEPDSPFSIITITWDNDDGKIIVDIRGWSYMEAYGILRKASEAIYEDFGDVCLVSDDGETEENGDDGDGES